MHDGCKCGQLGGVCGQDSMFSFAVPNLGGMRNTVDGRRGAGTGVGAWNTWIKRRSTAARLGHPHPRRGAKSQWRGRGRRDEDAHEEAAHEEAHKEANEEGTCVIRRGRR
jgi:hypothetical protein